MPIWPGLRAARTNHHDDEARAFLAAVMAAAEEFPEIEVALLDSLAHPSPARLLSTCLYCSAECGGFVFYSTVFYTNFPKPIQQLIADRRSQRCSKQRCHAVCLINL
jgi:hypothetical protein